MQEENMEKKYRIDTEENKKFLGELRKELLDFGHQFPSASRAVPTIWGMTEPRGKNAAVRHGSRPAWRMYIVSGRFWDIRAAAN